MPVTPAYPRYQLHFFTAEKKRQQAATASHLPLFGGWLQDAIKGGWFKLAADDIALGTVDQLADLDKILEERLHVHTRWHRMLISRDLACVAPAAVALTNFSLQTNRFVGEGAIDVLHRCTPALATDELRLAWLHERLSPRIPGGARLRRVHVWESEDLGARYPA